MTVSRTGALPHGRYHPPRYTIRDGEPMRVASSIAGRGGSPCPVSGSRGTSVAGSIRGAMSMATCAYCGETIVFGGVKAGDLRFCNGKCLDKARVLAASAPVPDEAVADLAHRIHSGPCPRCQGPGPVDVHMAYWVWSALAFTRWGNRQQVSCRSCAARSQAGRLALSAVFGWWGFPHGLIMTPVQVGRTAMAHRLAAQPVRAVSQAPPGRPSLSHGPIPVECRAGREAEARPRSVGGVGLRGTRPDRRGGRLNPPRTPGRGSRRSGRRSRR